MQKDFTQDGLLMKPKFCVFPDGMLHSYSLQQNKVHTYVKNKYLKAKEREKVWGAPHPLPTFNVTPSVLSTFFWGRL